MRKLMANLAPPAATLCLLAGLAADRVLYHLPSGDAETYHKQVLEAADLVPIHIGTWLGTEVPLPQSAVTLLHPNLTLSRRYKDIATGRQVTFVLVQCRDSRDLLGHYPPVCYSNHGYTQLSATPKDWQVDDLLVQGKQYEFSAYRFERSTHISVDDFMILPDGQICRDMDGVQRAAKDRRKQFFGAAQVQVVSDGSFSDAERDEITQMLIRANRPVIDKIRHG